MVGRWWMERYFVEVQLLAGFAIDERPQQLVMRSISGRFTGRDMDEVVDVFGLEREGGRSGWLKMRLGFVCK